MHSKSTLTLPMLHCFLALPRIQCVIRVGQHELFLGIL